MRSLMTRRFGFWSGSGTSALASVLSVVALLSVSPAFAAVDYGLGVRDRLDDVRELLDRRQAHRSMLNERVERFSAKLDVLQSEREAALETLADHEDRSSAFERELDRLMPRLLPRLDFLDKLRKNGARTISGLASLERHSALEERARSRLLATQTRSIEQMRRASTALRLLRRLPNTMAARHRDVDFQIPLLAASVSRLELRQSQLQRRRDAAVRDLAELTVDIDRLTAEEHRLARNIMARRLDVTGDDDSQPDGLMSRLESRRETGRAKLDAADVRGIALQQTQPTPVARPLDGIGAARGAAVLTSALAGNAASSAKGEASALVAGWASRKKPWAADVASLQPPVAGNGLTARVPQGQIEAIQTLVPTIETIGLTLEKNHRSGDRPEIEIAALPGQRVAAPNDGRIAFAGNFRSYGLLLIIEHGNAYHTLLWGFSSLDVGLGDIVDAGQIVGTLRDGPSPKLHVELRRNGQPVSPEVWLAASNSGVKG